MKKQLRYLMLALLCAVFSTAWGEDNYPELQTSNVTLTPGTNGSDCTVNGYDGIKVGTSSKGGDMKITVPAGTTHLHLHAAAWKGVTGLSLNISGATVSPTSISLTADDGIANNSPFTLQGSVSNFYYVIELSNITQETDLTLTSSIAKRFVVWGVNADSSSPDPSVSTITTITAPSDFNTNLYVGTTAGQLTATVKAGETTLENAEVTWSSTNVGVATVDANGNVALVAAGNAEIKATYAGVEGQYKGSVGTYNFTVQNVIPAPTGGKWVLTEPSDLQTNDLVVIVDQTSVNAMTNDNGTSDAPSALGINLNADKSEIESTVAETMFWVVTVNDLSYQFKLLNENKYLYCTSTNNGVRVGTNDNKNFEIKKNDNNVNYLYNTATGRYLGVYTTNNDWRCYTSINDNIKNTVLAFYKHVDDVTTKLDPELEIQDITLNVGDTKDLSFSTKSDGDITFDYSTQGVATIVKNGEDYMVTANTPGHTTVTATQASTDTYLAKIVTFTVTVPADKPEGALFYETFSKVDGEGGRDGIFSGSIGNENVKSFTDEVDWTFANDNFQVGANQCIKLGTTSKEGFATTRSIPLTGNGTLTFNAAGWYNDSDVKLIVSVKGAVIDGSSTFDLTNSNWNPFTVNLTNANGDVKITFKTDGIYNRLFIDDVLVTGESTAPASGNNYMTYCSTSDLDFEGKSLKAYMATQYFPERGTVGLTNITKVPAGTGIVIKSGNSDLPYAFNVSIDNYLAKNISADCSANMLVGVLAERTVTQTEPIEGDEGDEYTNFVLAKPEGKDLGFYIVQSGGGVIGANKAYLQIPSGALNSNSNGITFEFNDETDAIQGVETKTVNDDAWYTIQGVRVAQPTQSGIYIHNGRKVVVK